MVESSGSSFLRTEWKNIPVRKMNIADIYNIDACYTGALKSDKGSSDSWRLSLFLKNLSIFLNGAF